MENYNIYDEIGRGTHSFVYKARRKRSIEYVAVKSTAKCRMDKILNEVQLLHKLDSRYVLKFYNWYESQNHIWLIFEFCIGGDLLNLITQDKSLPEPAVKLFGSELVAGLQYLHSNGILFCDLKPANVLIDEFGSLKTLDLRAGFRQKMQAQAHRYEGLSCFTLAPGSPNYMAPELFHQPAIHSFASDFWALGCILYELCVGQQPFTHTNFSELARMIQNDQVELPVLGCDMCPSFWSLIGRLLEKDPYKRISWDELIEHPFWTGLPQLVKLPMPQQELFISANRYYQNISLLENWHVCIHLLTIYCEFMCESSRRVTEISSASSPKPEVDIVRSSNQHSRDDDAKDGRQAVEMKSVKRASRGSSSTTEVADEEDSACSDDEGDALDVDLGGVNMYAQNKPVLRPVSAPVQQNPSVQNLSDITSKNGSGTRVENSIQAKAPRTAPSAPITRAPAKKRIRFGGIFDRDGKQGGGLKKVSKLVFIAADCAVKPIVYSDDIEKIPAPTVRIEELSFQPMSADELLTCKTEKLENHLKDVYLSLKSSQATAVEKCSVLGYLFTLCLYSKLANVIVNSSILAMLARIISSLASSTISAGNSSILAMVCLDLGVMFRFATFIAPSSPDQLKALVSTLAKVSKEVPSKQNVAESDQNMQLLTRRRSVSCLGELLFYVSTQKDWEFPVAGLECVSELLDYQDLVIRHYAARTICNMLIHCSGTLLCSLVNEQVATSLVKGLVQLSTENNSASLISLRVTTTQAIAQLFWHLRTPSSLTQISQQTRVAILLLVSKLSVLQALWLGIAGKLPSCELAIASFNVLNSLLEVKTDRGGAKGELAAFEAGKDVLLERLSSFSVLAKILEKKSRFEDDAKHEQQCEASDSAKRETDADGHRRRYPQEENGVPNLLRAKAMLFIHLGVQLNKPFASGCIQLRYLDLVDRILLLFAPYLRQECGVDEDKTSLTSSPSTIETDMSSTSANLRLSAADVYMLQCALNLIKISIRTALKLSADCISAHDSDDAIEDRAHSRQTVSSAPFQLFDLLLRNPMCKAQLVSYFIANEIKEYTFFLRLMTKLLVTFPNETLGGDRSENTKVAVVVSELLLRLFQGSESDISALLSVESETLFTQLLPAVALQLHGTTTDGGHFEEELFANCIRIVYMALLHCDYGLAQRETAHFRDAFIKNHLFPCLHALLTSTSLNENVWRFAIELLFGLVSRDAHLLNQIEVSELIDPVLALLNAPQQQEFHSLPSSATKLVKMVVDSRKTNLDVLYGKGIVEALLAGLEFAGSEMLLSSLADLLAILYQLLFSRYEKLRRVVGRSPSPMPLKFDNLVLCGPLIVKLCAIRHDQQESGSPQQQESPSKKTRASGFVSSQDDVTAADESVADLASRCLVFLSQIFGEKLNDVIFAQKAAGATARSIFATLEQSPPDGFVILRVLLTLKNCLRCQSNSVRVSRWLVENTRLHKKVKNIAAGNRNMKVVPREAPPTMGQIAKTASDIIRLCQSGSATSS